LLVAKPGLLRYERFMSAALFDTHVAATRYRAAGFSESQVEALVETARAATELPDISTLATKADLERLALVTKSDIDLVGTRLDGKIEQLDGKLGVVQAELKAAIASSQLQTVYFVLTANVALTVLSTWLARLIR
jgi:hypothetical protein